MEIAVNLFICALLSVIDTTIGDNLTLPAFNGTRRILRGVEAGDSEPFMVYLRPAPSDGDPPPDPNWLCGGVIIHESYILTSAACIESIKHFYVVAGTHRWIPLGLNDECITNGAKKAVWKCVPIHYEFDGHQFENIRWMLDDIAVVRVEDRFNFKRRIVGCDFVPKKIKFNNISLDMERAGVEGLIAGWGSQEHFSDVIEYGRENINSPVLLETSVMLMNKTHCKRYWPERYHYIIDSSMICAKDEFNSVDMRAICHDQVKCKDLLNSKERMSERRSRVLTNPEAHNSLHSRRYYSESGGFCENDHGGPLVVGHGTRAVVVGVISASLTANYTRKCHGPFLFTSVYRNRLLITCAIDRENSPTCRKYLLRTTNTQMNETTFKWSGHPDGPAKSEIIAAVTKKATSRSKLSTAINNRTNKNKGLLFLFALGVDSINVTTQLPENVAKLLNSSRRIIEGNEVADDRPYMVYLKMPRSNNKKLNYRNWLCGGVIVHEEYILTSAACIQDAEHFYVVSGTYRYSVEDDRFTNACIKNGAKKAVWKCVPKNYMFDGHENDNIRWMNNDIAVVKIDEGFDFTRRVKGCEFIPKPICYNNQSKTLENPGTIVSIAGWGTTSRYNDWVQRRKENQQNLLEAHVEIISKTKCKRRWGSRYHNIIDNYMICSKDLGSSMSEICNDKYVDCQDIDYSTEDDGRRNVHVTDRIPKNLVMHSAYHNESADNGTVERKNFDSSQLQGGFCENDHGGPMVYGRGGNAIVIGIISACLVKERTNKCYGPFLYTSIYKNRQFISCAIYKDAEPKCRRQFRAGETYEEKVISWKNHPDGPAKNELDANNKVFSQKGMVMPAQSYFTTEAISGS
ncbi:unnamed protein product, partial [Iphiclides podalirius]